MKLLIFSDLDGTLLDHQNYDFAPARPMLDRLAEIGAPVILASSKTAVEMAHWQLLLGLSQYPAIVENGAALIEGVSSDADYLAIRRTLSMIAPPLRDCFRGFGDMTDAEVSDLTGLDLVAAQRARQRSYSEPGLWSGDEASLHTFLSELSQQGIAGHRGGRFLTLSFGGTKAQRMSELVERFRPDITVALGDAPNDKEMLLAADYGVVVRNDHGPGLPDLSADARGLILRTKKSGPAGWAEGMEAILRERAILQDGDTHG
ncbi:MAG: HAD-IIB family hydrolase [Rhizobiaceae bacterium]|nr:HAD-IIB family hydrolase [Rhizobiaceae bacterium]